VDLYGSARTVRQMPPNFAYLAEHVLCETPECTVLRCIILGQATKVNHAPSDQEFRIQISQLRPHTTKPLLKMPSWREEYLSSIQDAELRNPVNMELVQACMAAPPSCR
jgi:hypothetical protein